MTRRWIASILLLLFFAGMAGGLAAWKRAAIRDADADAANHPEPVESVTVVAATQREHRQTTTSIGTVLALRSITLRNELPGTVKHVLLNPGEIVEPGTLLVALDVSVEQAELKAREAEAALAQTLLDRVEQMSSTSVASDTEVDRARAERDVALAQIQRIKAIIDRKTMRAPFRARVGLADVHVGQYLEEGAQLTTLQGVDESAHVDFTVAQRIAAGLRVGDAVEVFAGNDAPAMSALIVAIDARVDATTRNAMVRARLDDSAGAAPAPAPAPAPGASVRVRVPVGPPQPAVSVPASALRRGPGGDHVFVIAPDPGGKPRAQVRQVQTGPMLGDEVLIHSGLSPGERVAAGGSFKLRESVLVAIAGEQAAADARTTR